MSNKFIQALCWAIIALLALGIITDWLVLFNFASLMAMPFLLAVALPEKVFEK